MKLVFVFYILLLLQSGVLCKKRARKVRRSTTVEPTDTTVELADTTVEPTNTTVEPTELTTVPPQTTQPLQTTTITTTVFETTVQETTTEKLKTTTWAATVFDTTTQDATTLILPKETMSPSPKTTEPPTNKLKKGQVYNNLVLIIVASSLSALVLTLLIVVFWLSLKLKQNKAIVKKLKSDNSRRHRSAREDTYLVQVPSDMDRYN